ncbi:hypothetical protein ABPG72_000326 [Tetrahymena utriculariae]
MNNQNEEHKENANSSLLSSMVNALVIITVIAAIIIPLLKNLKEQFFQQKNHANSPKSSQLNRNQSSPIQGLQNFHANSENQGQTNQFYSDQSDNTPSTASYQLIQRSQCIQQWNDRNEKFKQILDQQENPVTNINDYNTQVKKFIGQKISFNVKILFDELKSKGLEANCQTYEYLLQILLDCKQVEGALDLFAVFQSQFQKLEAITPNIICLFLKTIQYGLNNQISSQQSTQMVEQLNSVVNKYNLKMNEGSVIAMIDIALRSNKLAQALQTLDSLEKDETWKAKEDIQKRRCELYFQILKNLKGLQYSENDETLQKLCQMVEYLNEKKEEENIYPDEAMINSLIDLCFQCNQVKLALDVYGYFDKFSVSPSGVTYCILIKGYGQHKQFSYAMTIYQQMKTNKISLNEVTLGCLIDTCVKCNQLNKAEEILLEEKDIKPNTIIYTTLLKGYTKQENMKKALEIFEIMKKDKDLEPNIVSYNSLMECAVQCKDKEQMKKIFNEIMEQKEENKRADLITYSTYIKGLFKQGDIEEALDIFEDLRKQEQYKLDEIFYNSILDGLFKARSFEKTQLLYQKMRQDNIQPSNVTYSILIKLNSAQDKIDEALNILQEMKKFNIKPGLIVYTCLIQACIKHKRIRELLPLYGDMKRYNIRGDPVFYNTLVSGLMFNNCVNEALKMTIDTLEKKIILNQEVYQNLLTKVLSKRKAMENNQKNENNEIEQSRSRTYSGNTRFTSNLNQINSQNFETEQLTLQEIEKCLQKILVLLKKHQVEIDIDLYKEVVNQIFVNNNDEKKEYLQYLNQKGTSNMNRQYWGNRNTLGGNQNNSGFQNSYNSNYSTNSNKNKSQSFHQRKKTDDSLLFNNGSAASSQYSNNNSSSSYISNKISSKTNSGFENGINSNNNNQSNPKIGNNQEVKKFINKPKIGGGPSIDDLKNKLQLNDDNSIQQNKQYNNVSKNQNSFLSNRSEKDETQNQLLNEKNLEQFEKDSDDSFDSKGEHKNEKNQKKQKKIYFSKSKISKAQNSNS